MSYSIEFTKTHTEGTDDNHVKSQVFDHLGYQARLEVFYNKKSSSNDGLLFCAVATEFLYLFSELNLNVVNFLF